MYRHQILALFAATAAVSGCTTYKLWTETDNDPQRGILKLSYEFRKFQSPQVDERAGAELARERCADWGFSSAQRAGEERQCIDGTESDCSIWRVTRKYRCAR
jgi:hypothetical protein